MNPFFSQLDYGHVFLGNSTVSTLAGYGCIVVSIENGTGAESSPTEMNEFLKRSNCFSTEPNKKGWLNFWAVASAFNTTYEKTTTKPSQICLVETSDTNTLQHFFLYDPATDEMVDPLDREPEWRKRTYNIVSYRVLDGLFQRERSVVEEKDSKVDNLFQIIGRLARNGIATDDNEQKERICDEMIEKAVRIKKEIVQ